MNAWLIAAGKLAFYSYRSATIGSTFIARRAGRYADAAATTTNTTGTIAKAEKLSAEKRQHMLKKMLEIRYCEERIQELFLENVIRGTSHLCIGQEAVSVAMAHGGTSTPCSAIKSGSQPDARLNPPPRSSTASR